MNPRKLFGIAALLVFYGAGLGWAADYTIDKDHSKVMFKIKHLGISSVTGRFEQFSGTFQFDPQTIPESATSVTVDVSTINTDVATRDEHLRSADFFDVEKFPEMRFVSKEIRDATQEGFKVLGDLSLHGVTKPILLNVEIGGTVKDPWGNERAAFEASTTLNRKDFGIIWNKALETGGFVIGDDVRILLEIEGIKQAVKE